MTQQGQEGHADSPDTEPDAVPAVRNTVVAQTVSGVVIQAGNVHGGIHHHLPPHQVPTPRQLPPASRYFVGRTPELAQLAVALDTTAEASTTVVISALAGTGGIGKTALAVHWAHANQDRFPDGQLFVDLQGFSPAGAPMDPTVAVRGFLDAFGIEPGRIPTDVQAQAGLYRSFADGKRMLIVLDNAATVDQVLPLLPGSPTCTVIVTSRLRLTGLITAHGAQTLDLDVLPTTDARALLADHLGSARLTAEPAAVAELLAICAGLPLAARIVAARAEHHPTFPLAVLAEELRDATARLDGLDAGDLRSNLSAVLSWSARALSTPAVTVFGLLGIAPGPDISLPAAASLISLPVSQARAVLRELENASLVQQHTPGRYRMHDLIRLYATETAHHYLAEEVREAALRRVVDFYVHTAHTADRLLAPQRPPIPFDPPAPGVHSQPLPDASMALTWFDAEHPALLAAQHTAASHAWHPTVWQLTWAIYTFLYRRGHRHDQLAMCQAALHAAAHLPDPTPQITAHRGLGNAYGDLGRPEEAIGYYHQALAMAEQHHDPGQQAHTHWALALTYGRWGDYLQALQHTTRVQDLHRRALHHATRAQDLYRGFDQPALEATALNQVGWCEARLGDYDTARTHSQAALALHRHHHNVTGEAETLDTLGYIAHHSGHYQQAIGHYQQALTLRRALGDTTEIAYTLDRLGHPHVALAEHKQARVAWWEALQLYQEQGRETYVARIQEQLDNLDHRDGATHLRE